MSDTSLDAYESVQPYSPSLREMIYEEITLENATCDEIEELFNLRHQTASARIRELVQMGLIYDTGARRKTRSGRAARVYSVRNYA
jgi:predicted transcriptional regulator